MSLVLDTFSVEEKTLSGLSSVGSGWVSNLRLLTLEVGRKGLGVHCLVTEPKELL